jgi:ankyrin repeat protein
MSSIALYELMKTEPLMQVMAHLGELLVHDRNAGAAINIAAELGRVDVIAALLEHGVQIDLRHQAGHTPLISAAMSGRIETVRYLCLRGANVEAVDDLGNTALQLASAMGQHDVVHQLVRLGVGINAVNSLGTSALMNAVNANNPSMAAFLLDEGTNKDLTDNQGRNAMDMARLHNRETCLQLLQESA